MDDSAKKAGAPNSDSITQSGTNNFQLAANSGTANSSSSSVFVVDYAALRALQAGEEESSSSSLSSDEGESSSGEEESSSDEEDDIFIPADDEDDEDDVLVQDTIRRYLSHQPNASETAIKLKDWIPIVNPERSLYGALWDNISIIAGREDIDQHGLALLCKAILEEKDEKKLNESLKYLNVTTRDHWNGKCYS